MIRNQRDEDLPTKQEGSDHRAPPTSSRLWSGLKNPRIVRVSRAFGGKDRHSKVATVRGLRDRRVRLSVPTAIQLYDLQDRLGLNQPSKVVDWLLSAAQHEIDKLPPLQVSPEGFIQLSSQSHPLPHETTPSQSTRREVPKAPHRDKGNSTKGNDDDDFAGAQVLSHEILQRPNHSLAPGFMSNTMPYASYYQWEAANAYSSSLSQLIESQIVFCPRGIMPPMFTSNVATPMDFSTKQFGQLQTPQSNLDINSLHLSSPPARPFQ